MIRKNVYLLPHLKLSSWRKISLGSWRPNGDSQVYCELVLNAEPALNYLSRLSRESGKKITMTHLVGKVAGLALKEVPDLNSLVSRGKIYPRRDVDIFFHVTHDNTELSGHVVRNIDQKSVTTIAEELSRNAKAIRSGEDPSFKKVKSAWTFIPSLFAGIVLKLISYFSYSLNINLEKLNIPRDCFGGMMITNVGSLGFRNAFVPIAPHTKVSLVLALGRAEPRPFCTNEREVIVQNQMSLCFTFDHRVMDGARGAAFAATIKKYIEDPDLIATRP